MIVQKFLDIYQQRFCLLRCNSIFAFFFCLATTLAYQRQQLYWKVIGSTGVPLSLVPMPSGQSKWLSKEFFGLTKAARLSNGPSRYIRTALIPFPCISCLVSRPLGTLMATRRLSHESTSDNNRHCSTESGGSEDSVVLDVKIGCCSISGTDPDRPQKVNQDAYFSFSCNNNFGSKYVVAGVLDGHGLKGHIVSNFLASHTLPFHIQQLLRNDNQSKKGKIQNQNNSIRDDTVVLIEMKKKLVELGQANVMELEYTTNNDSNIDQEYSFSVPSLLKDAFLLAQHDCMQNATIPSGRSGATCVVAVIDTVQGIIDVAHVGDSRAILVRVPHTIPFADEIMGRDSDHDDVDDETISLQLHSDDVRQLTNNTSVQIPSERKRIESCEGSRIDPSGNVFYGPVGISMTRALGDAVMLRAGVLPIPFLTRFNLLEPKIRTCTFNDPINALIKNSSLSSSTRTVKSSQNQFYYNYLCLGTDGVFDVLSNNKVADIVVQYHRKQMSSSFALCNDDDGKAHLDVVASSVCASSRLAWLNDLPIETRVDDITFLIARVHIKI